MTVSIKKSKNTCDLRSCFLCKPCLAEWAPAIEAHRQNIHFKKGESIFQEGDPVTGMFFVYSGTVKVHKKWDQDKELIIRFATQGDVFGHRGLGGAGKGLFYPISATALGPVTTCFVDLGFFDASLRMNYPFMHKLLYFFAAELQESEMKMRNLAHMQVKGRVAHALLALQDKFGSTDEGYIGLTLSLELRGLIASFTGTTYETVFRIMNELLRDALISVSGKNVRILDPVGLRSINQGEQRVHSVLHPLVLHPDINFTVLHAHRIGFERILLSFQVFSG